MTWKEKVKELLDSGVIVIVVILPIFLGGAIIGFMFSPEIQDTEEQKESYLWDMGEQNLIFSMDQQLKLKVVSKDYYFREENDWVYLDSLSCRPHDCSRLTPYYKSYPKAVCLVCDYNASSQRQEKVK